MAAKKKSAKPAKQEDWFKSLEADLKKKRAEVSEDFVQSSGRREKLNQTLIQDFWKVWKKFHEIGIHFTMEPGYETWAIFADTFPNGPWAWRDGFVAAGVTTVELIDRTQDQARIGDALRCVHYDADGKARFKVMFEYCEGEHYYKYSGWKRLWSQHTLYDAAVDRVDLDDLHKLFADVVKVWFESHLRRDRDIMLKHLKHEFDEVETYYQ